MMDRQPLLFEHKNEIQLSQVNISEKIQSLINLISKASEHTTTSLKDFLLAKWDHQKISIKKLRDDLSKIKHECEKFKNLNPHDLDEAQNLKMRYAISLLHGYLDQLAPANSASNPFRFATQVAVRNKLFHSDDQTKMIFDKLYEQVSVLKEELWKAFTEQSHRKMSDL